MSTVQVYESSEPGAPVLTGEVGALAALLRKCLVGVSGIAYGSTPSAGWTEEFAGTLANGAVLRNSVVDGTGCYVQVLDNAPGTAGARSANVSVFKSMPDSATGAGGIGPLYVRKSSSLSATVRPWVLVADSCTFILYVLNTGDPAPGGNVASPVAICIAGDYACVDEMNAYRYLLVANHEANPTYPGYSFFQTEDAGDLEGRSGGWLADPFGIGGPVQARLGTIHAVANAISFGGIGGRTCGAGPSPLTGDYLISDRLWIVRDNGELLGHFRGIGMPGCDFTAIAGGQMVPGSDRWLICKFMPVAGGYALDRQANLPIDIQGPW